MATISAGLRTEPSDPFDPFLNWLVSLTSVLYAFFFLDEIGVLEEGVLDEGGLASAYDARCIGSVRNAAPFLVRRCTIRLRLTCFLGFFAAFLSRSPPALSSGACLLDLTTFFLACFFTAGFGLTPAIFFSHSSSQDPSGLGLTSSFPLLRQTNRAE